MFIRIHVFRLSLSSHWSMSIKAPVKTINFFRYCMTQIFMSAPDDTRWIKCRFMGNSLWRYYVLLQNIDFLRSWFYKGVIVEISQFNLAERVLSHNNGWMVYMLVSITDTGIQIEYKYNFRKYFRKMILLWNGSIWQYHMYKRFLRRQQMKVPATISEKVNYQIEDQLSSILECVE